MSNAIAPESSTHRELVITRSLKAPRQLVWRTFEDPYLLAQWWGPEGFTCPVLDLDFRVGGEWHVVLRAPDGKEYPAQYTFVEIVPLEQIVYRNSVSQGVAWKGNPPPLYTATLTFEELDGHTLLTIHALFEDVEQLQDSIRRGFTFGTNQALDKLERQLAHTS
jgi:uncharacterized protein YndB with AHSA1/START domain